MTRNRLYTVNKWNRQKFIPKENVFEDGGWASLAQKDFQKNPWNYSQDYLYGGGGPDITEQYMNSKNAFGISKKDNPFSKGNMASTGKSVMGAVASSIPEKHFTFKGTTYRRGMWDAADPLYQLAGDKSNVVGDAFSDTGVGLTKAGLQSGNGWVALAGGITKALGSLINAGWGISEDKNLKTGVDRGITYNNRLTSNANSFGELTNPLAVVDNNNVYKGGWFVKGRASRKNEQLGMDIAQAKNHAVRSIDNNIFNIKNDMVNNALRGWHAFGGPLDSYTQQYTPEGALGYNFISDYLTMKNRQVDNKGGMATTNTGGIFASGGKIHINPKNKGKFNATKKRTGKTTEELTHSKNPLTRKRAIFAQNARKWRHDYGGPLFAFGGDMETNSSDFPTGLTHIDAGGTHSENPYDGVQMGVDREGNPNLVEEGEVVYDDYVFSNRIYCDEETKQKFHISKKREITFAELAKKLEKEIAERPNDPISEAGFKAQMQTLEEEQERQKQEMEAERAREAFEALPPEEQVAIMNRAAQEEQMAQQAMQEQAMAQQATVPSGNAEGTVAMPEEAMMQQQVPVGDVAGTMAAPQMQAMGGRKYDDGGSLLDTVVEMEDPTMGTFGGIVVTPKNNEKKAALQINPLAFIDASKRREEIEERDNRDRRVEAYLDRLEDWLDTGRRNRSKIHYYAPGGELDNDWYNNLAPEYKWLVDQYKFTDANSLGRMPIAFQNALVKLYQRMQAVKDNPEYSDFSLAAANSNNFIKDDDFYTSLKNKGYDSLGFFDLTPEQWQSVYNDYLERHTTPQAIVQESSEVESKRERVSLKDRIDNIIDNISKRRAERKARRAERREDRQQSREERRQARLEAKEQDRLEKEQIHQLRALAKEEEAREKAAKKQQKQEQKEQVRAAKEALTLGTPSPNVTPITPVVTPPQPVVVQDDFPKRNPEYYNNGESTTMQEVTVTPPRTQRSTATIPDEELQDYTNRGGVLTNRSGVTTAPTQRYYYNTQGYDNEDDYRIAVYDDANKYNVSVVDANGNPRNLEDVISDVERVKQNPNIKGISTAGYVYNGQPYNSWDDYMQAVYADANKYGVPIYNENGEYRSSEEIDADIWRRKLDAANGGNTPYTINESELSSPTGAGDANGVGYPTEEAIQASKDYAKSIVDNTFDAANNYKLPEESPTVETPIITGNPAIDELNNGQGNPIRTIVKGGTPTMPSSNDNDATRASLYDFSQSAEGQEIIQNLQNRRSGKKELTPSPKDHWMRYAGLFGPAVGLGMMAAGVGKPDYSRLNAALASLGEPVKADYKPIGNYLTYRPMDIWYEQNRLNANARATDRAIMNNAAPVGTKMAGLLANAYNNQLASGNLYRQALEYNDNKRAQVEGFNRGTDQYNSQAYNQNSMFNAQSANAFNQARARLGLAAAQTRLDNDAGWYNSLYGNVNTMFKGVSDLGRDNTEKDWLKWLVESGALKGTTAAYGGKLSKKRKRGLTC